MWRKGGAVSRFEAWRAGAGGGWTRGRRKRSALPLRVEEEARRGLTWRKGGAVSRFGGPRAGAGGGWTRGRRKRSALPLRSEEEEEQPDVAERRSRFEVWRASRWGGRRLGTRATKALRASATSGGRGRAGPSWRNGGAVSRFGGRGAGAGGGWTRGRRKRSALPLRAELRDTKNPASVRRPG